MPALVLALVPALVLVLALALVLALVPVPYIQIESKLLQRSLIAALCTFAFLSSPSLFLLSNSYPKIPNLLHRHPFIFKDHIVNTQHINPLLFGTK
ncbi:hypothetical protein ACFLTJ_00635 [Chloroflexota bacterium]